MPFRQDGGPSTKVIVFKSIFDYHKFIMKEDLNFRPAEATQFQAPSSEELHHEEASEIEQPRTKQQRRKKDTPELTSTEPVLEPKKTLDSIDPEIVIDPAIEAEFNSLEFVDHECSRKLNYANEIYTNLNHKIAVLQSDLTRVDAIQDPSTRDLLHAHLQQRIAQEQTQLVNAHEIIQLLNLGDALAQEKDSKKIVEIKKTISNKPLPLNLRDITASSQEYSPPYTRADLAHNPDQVTEIVSRLPKKLSEEEKEQKKTDLKAEKSYKLETKRYIVKQDLERNKKTLNEWYKSRVSSPLENIADWTEKKLQLMSLIHDQIDDLKRIDAELTAISQGKTTLAPLKEIFPPLDSEANSDNGGSKAIPKTPETQVAPSEPQSNIQINQPRLQFDIAQLPTMGYESNESPVPQITASASGPNLAPKSRWKKILEVFHF